MTRPTYACSVCRAPSPRRNSRCSDLCDRVANNRRRLSRRREKAEAARPGEQKPTLSAEEAAAELAHDDVASLMRSHDPVIPWDDLPAASFQIADGRDPEAWGWRSDEGPDQGSTVAARPVPVGRRECASCLALWPERDYRLVDTGDGLSRDCHRCEADRQSVRWFSRHPQWWVREKDPATSRYRPETWPRRGAGPERIHVKVATDEPQPTAEETEHQRIRANGRLCCPAHLAHPPRYDLLTGRQGPWDWTAERIMTSRNDLDR